MPSCVSRFNFCIACCLKLSRYCILVWSLTYSDVFLLPPRTGNPRPILHWYKNNRLVDDTWTVTAQGIVRNELTLPRLERGDQGSVLTCQVLLNVSSPSAQSSRNGQAIIGGSAVAKIDTSSSGGTKQASLHVLKSVFSFITLELNRK